MTCSFEDATTHFSMVKVTSRMRASIMHCRNAYYLRLGFTRHLVLAGYDKVGVSESAYTGVGRKAGGIFGPTLG